MARHNRVLVFVALACIAAGKETYDEKTSAEYIWMNQVTDFPVDNIKNWSGGVTFDHVAMVHNPKLSQHGKPLNVLAIVAEYGTDECIVIFRGSKDLVNYILVDGNVWLIAPYRSCPECKVHKGFYTSWQSLKQQTLADLTALGCNSKPVRMTGHSLGAGLAALAAFDLAATHTIKHVYTYGQPRTGNAAWVDAFMNLTASFQYFRVVDYMDPVPRLPSPWMGGYQHAGPEVFYTATKLGSYHICASGEDKACGNQFGLMKCVAHGCDHCSYLGLNPCHANATKCECDEPKSLAQSEVTLQDQLTRPVVV